MKKRKLGRKLLSWLLTLAMVVGLMPGMGLTALAYEGDPYAGLVNTTTEITFDGKSWYLIDYDESTVTLLSKECVGASEFGEENTYDGSTVESAVNDYYEESISTDAKTAVSDNKMFLLSTDEAEIIYNANPDVLKCSKASDAEENIWWLRSQGYDYYYAAVVNGEDGEVDEDGENLSNKLGVRPALKLDLSKVTFDSESKTFSVSAAGYNVTITAGSNMTKTTGSGAASQTGLSGAMTDVVYTADEGYYFPTTYSVTAVNGISVTRNSYTQITVSGTPTADAAITLTVPTAKTTPATPTTVAAVDCTTSDNNDGKLTGVTTAMEYKKSDAESWTVGTGSDITGLVPGTYYVRVKATDEAYASGNQELTIDGVTASSDNTVTWSDFSDISIEAWESVTEDGVTVTLGSRSRFMNGDLNLGSCIFTASQGGISGITIQTKDDLMEPDYGGWPSGWIADGSTLTWSGDPAVEVSLEGRFLRIYDIQQIKFTMSDTGTGTKTVWTNETIEIDGEVTVNRRIIVNGNVTLNLKEGSKLIANAGINVSAGNSLTIQGSGELIASIDEQQSSQADHDMAAIGGNDEQDAGTITITGGTIEAHGGANAAGIGGGDHGNGGTVNISGGTVTAIGGSFGAGIGGGNGKNGGTVNISGGTVIATGGQYGKNGGSSSGIGKNGYGSDDGTLTIGDNVLMQVSSDNTTWSEYNGSDRTRYMKSHSPAIDILVTGLTLDKTTTQIIDEGNKVSFTATVSPDNASDKTVKWSVSGTNATAVKLYSDENCTTEVGTDATETLTVYAKGISAGSATVTCTSNADSTKSASCDVTVNAGNTTFDPASTYTGFGDLNTNDTEVTISEVSGKNWYVIANDSSTVTLLSKQSFGSQQFNSDEEKGNAYGTSDIKTYVEGLTGEGQSLAGIKDALADVSVTAPVVTGKVPYLLSQSEAGNLSSTKKTGAGIDWWLRSPGDEGVNAAFVYGESGNVNAIGRIVIGVIGVRPALKLDLSKVTFDSESKTFSLAEGEATATAAETLAPTVDNDNKVTEAKILEYAGKQWYVIASGTTGVQIANDAVTTQAGETALVLLAKDILANQIRFNSSYSNVYKDSALYSKITELEAQITAYTYGNDWEKNLIAKRKLAGEATSGENFQSIDNISGGTVDEATLWPLSAYEAGQLSPTILGTDTWWLRSPGNYGELAACVYRGDVDHDYVDSFLEVRPALCLNLTSEIFASEKSDEEGVYELTKAEPAKGNQDAPTGLTATKASSDTAADGKISGVTDAMEYQKDGDTAWTAVGDSKTEITGLAAGTYKVRYAETADKNASPETTVTIDVKDNQEAPTGLTATKASSSTATDGKISGVNDDMEYQIDGATTWTTVGAGKIEITGLTAGTYKVRYVGTADKNASPETTVTIGVKEDQTAPTGLTATKASSSIATDGKISGVNDDMEYQKNDTSTWTAVGAGKTEISGLTAGTYKVRYVGKADKNASPAVTVEVGVKVAPIVTAPTAKTLTYDGSVQALVNAGITTGGTMNYAVSTNSATAPSTGWSTSIPTGTNAGTYYVWYMVVGNENYNDSEPACVEVTVSTNKAAMSEEIDAADNFYNEIKEDYPEIADELSRVIKDAVAVKDNPDATQDEINAAEKAVKDATSNAKEILIQINLFVEGINDITQVVEDNKDDIKDLLASYDELPDSIRTAVDNKIGRAGTKKLSDLEDALEVVDKIDSIETAENIILSDEEAVTIARTAYELLSESEKALISGDVIEKLEAAEAKIEELKNNEALNAAKASAIGRLEDYVDAKALSDATQDEDKAIKDVVDAEIEKINAAADMDAVAKALTAAKAAVDAALAKIAEDRAAAAAAAQEMAEADDALETAKENAESAIKAADEAAADEYASGTDKKAISDAKDAVEKAVNAAEALSDTASATAKKAAAKAIEDAVAALNEAVDKATVNSDAARAKAEEEADAAAQLEAAKDSAIDRLNDYSEAKALADATDTEKEAYNKAVTDGKTAIEAATTIEAVAAALANAKAAVDAALAKIAEDRAAAAAAAQEMAEADEAVADALVYADVSKADAVEAAADEYASNADKQDIATAMATLEGAINAAKQLAADASAETKREAAQAVMNAAAALDQVVDAAKVRSAAAKAAATELAAARASACERLDDYSEAKALADATDAEKEAYNKAVTDGKTAINAAATTEAVAEALKAAKAAVDAALAKIAEDRAAAAEAAAEMEEADESLELARTIAGLAKAEAEKAANDEYASDTDKNAITTAKATLEGAINAAAQLAADASAAAKRAAAQTIVNAANALYDVCETAERNSAAAKADAEAAAAAAAALAAAREYACERLDDFTDAKALDDATEAEQKEYDDVIAAEKEKINAAADQAAIDEALKAAKAAVNAELAKIKDDRTKAAAVVEMISGLPATEEIVLDDKEAVEAARTAYDALTDDQKLKVSDEVVKTLEDAEDMVVIRQVKSEIIARTGMIYNGQAFQLIDTPETDLPDGFTMMYAVTTENVEPDALEYAEDIPEAVEFGNYYVWFKVVDEQDNIRGGVSSVEVTIIRPTEIVTQPAAAKVIRGSKAKFSVEATGDDLTYVWQISKDGVNWSNSTASGCDTDKITFRATKALNGRYYRCVITGAGGVVISDAVKLTTLAVINGQPGDAAATIGSDATFSVSSRSSAATYQWQVSTDGGETWKKSSAEGCDTEHLTVNVKSAKYGEYLFRCKVTNGTWVEYSKAAGIDIVTFIVKQPETIFASEGDKVKLYVKATGIAPTYQWEVMTGAGNWVNSTAPGNATNIITFKATAEKTAYKWRCKITDGDTVLYSDVVTLVIESGQYED